MKKITKAVFPVAGIGSRFLPATKASPKEMMPIVDKPLIQYAVEEAIAAGFTEMIFITGRGKRAIEDHFDTSLEVEMELEARGNKQLLKIVQNILPKHVSCTYVRQSRALGLGHAILCAKPVVGDNAFAVLLADVLLDGKQPELGKMKDIFLDKECSIVGVQSVDRRETEKYGIVKSKASSGALHQILGVVEKPKPKDAPSTLAIVGRYVFTPTIFTHLGNVKPGAAGEIQLTDGIASLIRDEPVLGYELSSVCYDCGSKLGYLMANLAFGIKHPEVGKEFREYLASLGCKLK
jgi:UTP--glucose-1-phosphate uridylyltransferase